MASSPIARPRGTTDKCRTTTTNSSSSHHHDSAPSRPHPLICTGAEPIHTVHGPPKMPAWLWPPETRSFPCHFGGFSYTKITQRKPRPQRCFNSAHPERYPRNTKNLSLSRKDLKRGRICTARISLQRPLLPQLPTPTQPPGHKHTNPTPDAKTLRTDIQTLRNTIAAKTNENSHNPLLANLKLQLNQMRKSLNQVYKKQNSAHLLAHAHELKITSFTTTINTP